MINTTEFITTPIGYDLNIYSNSTIAGAIIYFCNKYSEDIKTLINDFDLNASPSELIANFVIATNKDCDEISSNKQTDLRNKFSKFLKKISNDLEDKSQCKSAILTYARGKILSDIIITKHNVIIVEGGTPVTTPNKIIYQEQVKNKNAKHIEDKYKFKDNESERIAYILEYCRVAHKTQNFTI